MKPFTVKYFKSNFLIRLLGLDFKDRFLTDLNNLLATIENPQELSRSDIENLLQKYNLSAKDLKSQRIKSLLKKPLEDYILYVVREGDFVNSMQGILHLLDVMQISLEDVQDIAEKALEIMVMKVAEDLVLDESERSNLEALIKTLRIPDKRVKGIYSSVVKRVVMDYIQKATRDGSWSPDEEGVLIKFVNDLGINLELDEETKEMLERLRFVWEIENGILPVVDADVKLRRGEVCHFRVGAKLWELKRKRISRGYAGPRLTYRVAKGLYLSYGAYKPQAEIKEVYEKVDEGELYLTNKKILFVGKYKSISLNLNRVIDIERYINGVALYKESGKPLIFTFQEKDVDKFILIFTAIWDTAL